MNNELDDLNVATSVEPAPSLEHMISCIMESARLDSENAGGSEVAIRLEANIRTGTYKATVHPSGISGSVSRDLSAAVSSLYRTLVERWVAEHRTASRMLVKLNVTSKDYRHG